MHPAARPDAGVDWAQPWFAPYCPVVQQLLHAGGAQSAVSLADWFNAAQSRPVQFAPQSALPEGQAYEQFIFETGQVPTRDNLHDFFNGLCWLRFPQTKRKLNQLQAAEIARNGVQGLRGPVRDALTVFDENAAFLLVPAPLWEALLVRDWHGLFVTLRPLWRQAELILFGHALLEKLVSPRKAVVAHVWCAQPAIESIADLDEWIATDITAEKLATKPFTPLPVLGVPGWWPENENFSFYDDSLVFRPRRQP